MGLDFTYPWALLLIPVGLIAAVLIDRRYRTCAPSLKRRVSLWVRLLLTVLLVLAIAAPSVLIASGRVTRWVLLDVSDSTAAQRQSMQSKLKTALSELPAGQEAGVIAFGQNAMVEVPLQENPAFTGAHAAVGGTASLLDDALLLASALMPSEGAGGITVLSDDQAVASTSTVHLLNAHGLHVDTLSFAAAAQEKDAQMSELLAPKEAYLGQSISLQVLIDANSEMSGTLALYQNGEITATREVSLQKGENRFVFSVLAQKTGVVNYEAKLMCQGDAQSRNNNASAYARVLGAPNVLLVSQNADMRRLFDATGMKVNLLSPAELPTNADGYLSYDAVVLNNIDIDMATAAQWQALDAAVRTLGRGLCVLGGDSSYALGGYRGSVLEALLPVNIDVRNKLQMPALSLIIAIDKSGSMTMGQYGTSRIEVAKEAALRAVEVLGAQDQIGVIGFDDAAKWVVPFQSAANVSAVQSLIGTLRADGGTAFYSPLSLALDTLREANTPQKHIIFLSDGQPGDVGFEKIALAMSKSGITLTTVAVGSDANAQLMKLLSTLGGGRAYEANEFDNIPKIFTKETMLAGGSYVQNRSFTPLITENSALTAYEGLPMLNGYLSTVEKSTANVALTSDREDPLLAWWNVGAGKVLAWTSDAEGAWSENYLRWEQGPNFFGGMVAKVLPSAQREGTISASIANDQMTLTYTVDEQATANESEQGTELSELVTMATVVSPEGKEQKLPLSEVEPGVFEGEALAAQQGVYTLRVTQTMGDTGVRSQESGAVKGFAQEYDLRSTEGMHLAALSEQTGGKALATEDGLWNTPIPMAQARKQMLPWLCVLAMLLLLLDIALRKLPWEEGAAKLWKRWTGKEKKPESEKTGAACAAEETVQKNRVVRKRDRKQAEEQARKQAAAQTADALLEAKRAREKR
ncbi:MAG: vWA domain-containing protein [Clostridia bacterium]